MLVGLLSSQVSNWARSGGAAEGHSVNWAGWAALGFWPFLPSRAGEEAQDFGMESIAVLRVPHLDFQAVTHAKLTFQILKGTDVPAGEGKLCSNHRKQQTKQPLDVGSRYASSYSAAARTVVLKPPDSSQKWHLGHTWDKPNQHLLLDEEKRREEERKKEEEGRRKEKKTPKTEKMKTENPENNRK